MNLYTYVGNSPIDWRDPTGLYKLKNFPASKIGAMNNAIQSAVDKLEATCPSCAGPDGAKIISALEGATYVYVPNLKTLDGQHEECANSRPIKSSVIHVGSSAFDPVACCRLDSTLAHEATHKVTQSPGEGPPLNVEDQCFGCH